MTILRPNQHNGSRLLRAVFFGLFGLVAGGLVVVVALYNERVGLRHEVETLGLEFRRLEAQNAELQDALFTAFDGVALEQFAAERGLLVEREPEYFILPEPEPLEPQPTTGLISKEERNPWELASHF